jgi:hypothetical protein
MTKTKRNLFWSLCVLVASFAYFYAIFALKVESDLADHALSIRDFIDGKILPPTNFLFYIVVYITALFKTDATSLFVASSLILAVAVAAKFIITRQLFKQHMGRLFPESSSNNLSIGLSLSMLVVFNLPLLYSIFRGQYYIGQIPPNVWHNSTTIFLMPFALLLFFKSYEQLEQPSSKGILPLVVLVVLNILAKPSFFFVFCLIYPLMLLRVFGLKKSFWQNLTPVVAGVILVAFEYYLTYKLSFGNLQGSTSSISIDPFRVWRLFSNNIPLSLLASLVFPLAYLAIYWKDLLENHLVQYSVLAYLVGLAIFCLLAEPGPRITHGNFFWQAIVCSYLLFLVLLIQFVNKVKQFGLKNWRNGLILTAFSLHALSGIIFLARFIVTRTYFH